MVGSRYLELKEVHYLWGLDIQESGKLLRRMFLGSGHRSILRIGPAGEQKSAMAGINVDTYRHFGRLGGGAALGAKNLKAIVIIGDGSFPLMEGKDYPKLFEAVYQKLTATDMMQKYHNLGTPVNVAILNEQKALPWRNLQATTDPNVHGITGERFAETALLRNAACAGCPVGCIDLTGVTLGGHKVTGLVTQDGYKFVMDDGGWLLVRFSGTEPLLRVYTETTDGVAVPAILEDGKRLAGIGMS